MTYWVKGRCDPKTLLSHADESEMGMSIAIPNRKESQSKPGATATGLSASTPLTNQQTSMVTTPGISYDKSRQTSDLPHAIIRVTAT